MQAAGTDEIDGAVNGRGGGGVYRCPSQMRTVREASAKSTDRSSSCLTEPGTCTERSGERAAGGVLFFSFFTIYYILYTIPTLTHSSHPTHRIVAAFALPLS